MFNLKKKLIGNIVPVPSFYKNNLEIDFNNLGKFIDFQQDNDVRIFYLALSASEFEFINFLEFMIYRGLNILSMLRNACE